MIKGVTIIDIVNSIDGVLAREADSVVKLLALNIASGWVRVTLAFVMLRATNLCIRGSRVKWRSVVHMEYSCTSAYE